MEKVTKILIISSDKNLKEVLSFCFDGWGYEVFLQSPLSGDIMPIKRIAPDIIIMDVHSASKAQLEICHLLKDDFTTSFIPIITMINKRQLRAQLLNLKYGVDDYLIKPPDPLDLRVRIEMAMRRAQYSFYASALTGLPGGRIIEEILKDKLKKSIPFSFGYVDLDNFKYFNDVYGYLKGDRVIMQAAYMLYVTVKKFGNKDDFIGHIGGDDFVFISTPDSYRKICQNFIFMFDKIIPFHYSETDREQGFVVARDRSRTVKRIPLMSVSVAVVNRNEASNINNIVEINEKVAEIKHYLKGISGSKFMADRRNLGNDVSFHPEFNKKEAAGTDYYKPLGQILIGKNIISAEQLDEALDIHWKRGILLGEVLEELGFVKEEELTQILAAQKPIQVLS
ncbi:MAG: diguanylate cyclase [Candidatus Omnitrophica bacterium]|nr:diguanylate cyclase [Candidatus Omnitrophota bacterium]